jgi:Spy/CpxP family protein refolding chaperone
MKLGWMGAMTLGGLIALEPLAQAQEKKQDKPATPATPAAPAATPAAPTAAPGAPPTLSPDLKARRTEAQVNSWARMYGLTDEQKTKAKPIVEEQFKKLEELDKTLPIEERRKKIMEIRDGTLAKLKALLTPEQRQKMDSLPQRGQVRPAPGAPGTPGAPGAPANPAAPK